MLRLRLHNFKMFQGVYLILRTCLECFLFDFDNNYTKFESSTLLTQLIRHHLHIFDIVYTIKRYQTTIITRKIRHRLHNFSYIFDIVYTKNGSKRLKIRFLHSL